MKYQNRIVGNGEEPLDQIMFNPRNWRIHPLHQQDALKGVLEEVGWVQQVIVNKRTGNLIDGHLRCQLAAREGNDTIPVVYVDVSEEEEALILSTLDPIAGMAATDKEKLDDLFRQFNSDNENVQKLIADIAEKEKLEFGKKPIEDVEPQIDKAEELRVKWGVETGQMWKLGEHRIICGDCTDKAVVDKLMQCELAGAVVTDPPYGINLDTDYSTIVGGEGKSLKHDKIIGDDTEYDPAPLFEMFGYCDEIILFGADYYLPNIPNWKDGRWLIWDKRVEDKYDSVIGSSFEVLWTKKKRRKEILRFQYVNWGARMADGQKYHPTMKPVALILALIERMDAELIVDPYVGSGTTILACESLSRKCRAIEISPAYVAVSIQRWVDATGGVPELNV